MYLEEQQASYESDLKFMLRDFTKLNEDLDDGHRYCISCDPRVKILFSPKKTRNNILLSDQITYNQVNKVIQFRRNFKSNIVSKSLNSRV